MSKRTICLSESNNDKAKALANCVLPTPVGPKKRKLPSGRLGSLILTRARNTAAVTRLTASSCPLTFFLIS